MDNINNVKIPKTFNEQIDILQSRGLIIKDIEEAVSILKSVNYYRLSAYMLSLKNNNIFEEGTTFKNIYDLYEFDKKLRLLFMDMLERIEIAFRTHISYLIGHKYGSLGYEDSNNFISDRYHSSFINELNKEVQRNNEIFIQHHRNKYEGRIPIWVATEVMSFGVLSRLFSNMKTDDKKFISKEYYNVPYKYIESWLMYLSYIRNVCAHYGRLYNRNFVYKPRFDKIDKNKGINSDKIFAAIYVIKKLSENGIHWNDFVVKLQALLDEYDSIELNLIGFRENWYDILLN